MSEEVMMIEGSEGQRDTKRRKGNKFLPSPGKLFSHSQGEDKKRKEFGKTGERDPHDGRLSCLEAANTQRLERMVPS